MLSFHQLLVMLIGCFASFSISIYLLYNFNSIFKAVIKNEWLRVNIVMLVMLECFSWTLIPIFHDFNVMEQKQGFLAAFLFHNAFLAPVILAPVNIILWLKQARFFKILSFTKRNIEDFAVD